jgi:Zn-dependent M28 family amino/carboxypeptidase
MKILLGDKLYKYIESEDSLSIIRIVKIKNEDKDKYKYFVDFHRFTENGIEFKNIICQKQGRTNKFVLICGHYDTILGDNFEDTVSRAPGANDNASGVAAILEIARIFFFD